MLFPLLRAIGPIAPFAIILRLYDPVGSFHYFEQIGPPVAPFAIILTMGPVDSFHYLQQSDYGPRALSII